MKKEVLCFTKNKCWQTAKISSNNWPRQSSALRSLGSMVHTSCLTRSKYRLLKFLWIAWRCTENESWLFTWCRLRMITHGTLQGVYVKHYYKEYQGVKWNETTIEMMHNHKSMLIVYLVLCLVAERANSRNIGCTALRYRGCTKTVINYFWVCL